MTRKKLTEKDNITSALEKAVGFGIRHGRTILTAVGVVLIVVLAFTGWTLYSASVESAAQDALGDVLIAYSTVVAGDQQARLENTVAEAERMATEHSGTQAALVARYYAAIAHDELGNADQADAILTELIDSGDPTIRDQARFARAELYKDRGDLEGAIAEYHVLAESGDYARSAVLFELGRLHEAVVMPEEAIEYYETLTVEDPTSPYRQDADRSIRRIRAEMESSSS
jgi:tetratricopeptide (TPR) repeat protein